MEDKLVLSFAERYEAILKAYSLSPASLAKRMEEPPAKFYKYAKGMEPRPDFILRLLNTLPGLSEQYVLHGIEPIKNIGSAGIAQLSVPPMSADLEELIRLRLENAQQKGQIQELKQQLVDARNENRESDREWRDWAKEGFCESDSHSHRFEQLRRQSYQVNGLVRYDLKAEGKVIALNAEPKRYVLNSLHREPGRQTA